jgi:hypothetical protein
MKKIILTSTALIAFAAATYAQVVQQVGQQQFAQHNQFGANQTGVISQVQSAVDPNLVNYGNYAITFQGTPNNTGANTLTINQNNGSQGNRAGIGQSGGPNNNATISQSGGPSGLSGGATSVSATIGAPGEDGNFAGISQIGAANTAIIREDNNSRRNKAETYQNGTGNTATTNQRNNSVSNTAFVMQGFTGQNVIGSAVNNAVATVNQGRTSAGDASFGVSVPESVGNTAMITQTASNVTATVNQGATVDADGDGAISAGRSDGSSGIIAQSATGNTATINQGAESGEAIQSKATITQTNINNTANVYQGALSQGSDQGSTATVVQNGKNSLVQVYQGFNGASNNSTATITQNSTTQNGTADIFQGFGGGSYSSNDKGTITQGGTGNITRIAQNSAGDQGESNGRDNTATITQADVVTNSRARVDQGYTLLAGQILQTNRNTATISQSAGTNLSARIGQSSLTLRDVSTSISGTTITLNGLNGTPVTLAGSVSNDNTASITQSGGDNHNANLYQTGRFNTAAITQSAGNASQALIIQTANSQRAQAIINQSSTGTGNAATILQFAGSNADGVGAYGNTAMINQISGSNNVAFVQQGLQGVATSSNDNSAMITQNGSNNFARFLQVGNNNMVNITQNGNNNQVLNLAGDPGSYGSQQGYNNRLTLVQEGGNTGVTFKYTQIGNNNTQVVNQHF